MSEKHGHNLTFHGEGMLVSCSVCLGAEGDLPKLCPGRAMSERERNLIRTGELDFVEVGNQVWSSYPMLRKHSSLCRAQSTESPWCDCGLTTKLRRTASLQPEDGPIKESPMTTPKFERLSEQNLKWWEERGTHTLTHHIRAAYAHMDHLARVSAMRERYARALEEERNVKQSLAGPDLRHEVWQKVQDSRAALAKEGLL